MLLFSNVTIRELSFGTKLLFRPILSHRNYKVGLIPADEKKGLL